MNLENLALADDLIATSEKIMLDRIEDKFGSHHEDLWHQVIEEEREKHEKRVRSIIHLYCC